MVRRARVCLCSGAGGWCKVILTLSETLINGPMV
jgi:hypothetical protein